MDKEAVKRLKQKLERLKSLDKNLTVFGAERHSYLLRPHLDEATIVAFEHKNEITLPQEYRTFLLELGNGGAGPAYGVFPLNAFETEADFSEEQCIPAFLTKAFPYHELHPYPEEGDMALDALDDEDYALQVQGSLPLAHLGCGMMVRLVLSGENHGELWLDDRSSDYGIYLLDKQGFAHWYESWLDKELQAFEVYEETRDFIPCEVVRVKGHGRARYASLKNLRLSQTFRLIIWHFYYIDDREFLPTDGRMTAPKQPRKRATIDIGLFASDSIHPFSMEAAVDEACFFSSHETDQRFEAVGVIKKAFIGKHGQQLYQVGLPSVETSMVVECTKETTSYQSGERVRLSGRLDLEFRE